MQRYYQIPVKVKCPVCGNYNASVLWNTSSEEAAQHFVLKEKHIERFSALVSHIENLWGQNTCEVVQCDNCEFCYSNPYIAGDERFYTLAYTRSGYPSWKWEFQLTYKVLSEHSGSNIKLLEIGAGDGSFVKRVAKNILQKTNILCTEFSDYGLSQIEKLGIKCVADDVRNFSTLDLKENFDVVCMFQVLEHLDRLDILFNKLRWLLKNEGSLFIAVPNEKRIKFNELSGALLDMPPNHIGRWNKKSFEEIGKKFDFHIQDYRIENDPFITTVKQFIIYRMLRKSQQSGSFENWIFQIKNRYTLRIMQLIAFAINFIKAIPALSKINSSLGTSQWVHFIKEPANSPLSQENPDA